MDLFLTIACRRWYNVFEIVSPQSIFGINVTLVKQNEIKSCLLSFIAFCIWIVSSTNENRNPQITKLLMKFLDFFFYRLSSTEKSSFKSRFSVAVEIVIRYQNMVSITRRMFCVHFFPVCDRVFSLNASAAMLLNTHFCHNLIQMQPILTYVVFLWYRLRCNNYLIVLT